MQPGFMYRDVESTRTVNPTEDQLTVCPLEGKKLFFRSKFGPLSFFPFKKVNLSLFFLKKYGPLVQLAKLILSPLWFL